MRLALIVVCALALGGCNLVYSERPLFTDRDAKGAPQLRPGVWMKPEKDCAFDQAKPVKSWPDCAGGMIVRSDRLIDPANPEKTIDYLLVGGRPVLFQVPFVNDDKSKTVYLYGGIGSLRRDAQSRVVGFVSWLAQCGPPPPKPKPGDPHPRYITEHPLPGLKLDEKSGMCAAEAQAPVRASVKASEVWDADTRPASWVRDGEE